LHTVLSYTALFSTQNYQNWLMSVEDIAPSQSRHSR